MVIIYLSHPNRLDFYQMGSIQLYDNNSIKIDKNNRGFIKIRVAKNKKITKHYAHTF